MTVATGLTRLPAVEGFFTMGDDPQLIGGRLETGGYCFPVHLGGSDPRRPAGAVEEVLLSRYGTIWSFTNSAYPPPPPFIVAEPYVPVVVAAVELAEEQMLSWGRCRLVGRLTTSKWGWLSSSNWACCTPMARLST